MSKISESVQEEFNEQVRSVYRRSRNKAEAERELSTQGEAILGQVEMLAENSEEFQVYIGLAFHRRLSFEKKAMLETLISSGPCATKVLASLRTHKMIRVSASAKTAWDGLWEKQPQAMWNAVILNSREQLKATKVAAEAEELASEANENDEEDLNNDD